MDTRRELIDKLKAENAFWSYDNVSVDDIDDDMLIEKTLIYLDIPEIKSLFNLFPLKKIKSVWLHNLVPQGDYLKMLNRFFAWYLFGINEPDRYLKSMETRHLNSICQ